eukprot:GILK01002517.1.p1 GENE.GILK01002517.1~~GILK01002517.1.p1  ORF type:complete len:237 (-),score=19.07 GILK01002517.1:245-892(-)
MEKVAHLYPYDNYTFEEKDSKQDKDYSVQMRLHRMKDKYEREGMRRHVEAILLVHIHNHPHMLLIQAGTSFYKLPGGRLKPGEVESEGLLRKLNAKLSVPGAQPHWEVSELISSWWRPNFDTLLYPYVPPHVTRAKECKKLFLVQLPEKCTFHVPKNYKLLAVPLFDLYESAGKYGNAIASLPESLSRIQFIYNNSIRATDLSFTADNMTTDQEQ